MIMMMISFFSYYHYHGYSLFRLQSTLRGIPDLVKVFLLLSFKSLCTFVEGRQ